ncbi:hypothetical protein EDD53_0177 [Pacificibacter maritimus]|uniref:Lipid A 3-O-deacylase PagL n=1 Tax=Pacificibacter maritimus TaxID=762213 RepID=A0A3N4VDP7_9RHOB|nr:hypothetical protein [Pacificibacter maritimus]RPE71064.1 hypothetical protein EDD53_0177 [Pacificibacter maritimus]
MQIKSFFTALSVALAPLAATADGSLAPDVLQIPLASHHFGDWGESSDFNEFNPGVILTWEDRLAGLNYSIGAYKDSKSATALHLSAAKMWDIGQYTQAGIVGAYIHSFGDGYTGIAPSIQLNHKYIFVNVATGYDDDFYGVVGTGITIPLGR